MVWPEGDLDVARVAALIDPYLTTGIAFAIAVNEVSAATGIACRR
jgi:hypothetical protein